MPLNAARKALAELPATGELGFEGLLAELLSAQLGVTLRLCASGRQYGRDMGGGTIAAEAKRYDRSPLDVRSIVGEIVIAKGHSPQLTLWALGATVPVSQQDAEEMETAARTARVDLALLDWSPGACPRLLVLIAQQEALAAAWFKAHAPDQWKVIAAALAAIRGVAAPYGRVCRELDQIASGVGLLQRLRETVVRGTLAAVADPSGAASIQLFGQRIDLEAPQAGAVERAELNRNLAAAFSGAQRIVAVIGPEGVGKSWAIVRFALKQAPDRPLLFLSSAHIEDAERRGEDGVALTVAALMRGTRLAEDCDPRFLDHAFMNGLLRRAVESEAGGLRPFIVIDGYAERQGGRWPSLIADIRRDLCVDYDFRLAVTARPMSWPRLRGALQRAGDAVTEVEVGPFSEIEFAEACAARDIDPGAFDPVTAADIRNPRLFRIAANLVEQLAGAPVTRERVFWEYWRHRQADGLARQLEPEDFTNLLKAHVKEVWKRLDLRRGDRTLYFDIEAKQEAARFAGVEAAVTDVDDIITSGFFWRAMRDDSREYTIEQSRLYYVIGLSLQRRLAEVTDNKCSPKQNRAAVNSKLQDDIDPISDTDAAGVIVATALLAACLQRNQNAAVAAACLVYLIGLRNARNDEGSPTVRGMVFVAACAAPAAFVAAVDELSDRDPWIVEALRIGLAISNERDAIADSIKRWLSKDEDEATSTALHALAGHDLAPFKTQLRSRHESNNSPLLRFWLIYLDEASRAPLSTPGLSDEDAVAFDEDGDENEDEDCADEAFESKFLRIVRAAIAKRRKDRRASPATPELGDDVDFDEDLTFDAAERGYVPSIAPSLGAHWTELDAHIPSLMAELSDQQGGAMKYYYIQLLENRCAALDAARRLDLLQAVFIASSPPIAPPHYQLRRQHAVPPHGVERLLAAAIHTDQLLERVARWVIYFGVRDFTLSQPTSQALISVMVDAARSHELRADVAMMIGSCGDPDLARALVNTGWSPESEPDSIVRMQGSHALIPLCAISGGYTLIRNRIGAAPLYAVIERVHGDDLLAAISDFDAHIRRRVEDIAANKSGPERLASGRTIEPPGDDRRMSLAMIEISVAATRRIAEIAPRMLADWFDLLMAHRSSLMGDLMISGFAGDLVVGLGTVNVSGAADALERLIDCAIEEASEMEDGAILSDWLIVSAFALPRADRIPEAVTRLVRAAYDDSALCQIARAARGAWRDWLRDFCAAERGSDRPARVARARMLQAFAGLDAPPLPRTFHPQQVERHATLIDTERRAAEAALADWLAASDDQRTEIEMAFFRAATGQVIAHIDLSSAGELGALFEARINDQLRREIEGRGNNLFGLPAPPPRLGAANCPPRVFPAGANRRRRFAERAT